ncbi:MAG TPA: hypothetical protein VJZ93_00235 [Candidatus Nanoarchaeia archaeon]|nr:hypothetical protein [Candidatus Nanoarchaeia archaeon]
MDRLTKKAFGKSALWIPSRSIITRRGFSISAPESYDCYNIGDFTVETKAPFIYAVTLSDDKNLNFLYKLLNVVYGEVIGFEEEILTTASFEEMFEKGIINEPPTRSISEVDKKFNGKNMSLLTNPDKPIGCALEVRTSGDTLYRTVRPLLVDYKGSLLL